MEDVNVVIAGSAGEGIQTIGTLLAAAASESGYAVFAWQEYESRIRGGQNSFSLRIGQSALNAPMAEADILVALNEVAASKYNCLLKKEGLLLAQKGSGERCVIIPFLEISQKIGGEIYSNAVAAGAAAAMLDIAKETLLKVIGQTFAQKGGQVVEHNIAAATEGFLLARQACQGKCPWSLPQREGRHQLVDADETIALGAVMAGCRFISAYPMTPSTGIITFFARHQERLGVFAEQAEDEISAINMALGASYAGARAMTATSGGGFALMVEGISLAGMTETPVVIVLGQRPGPATGLPTRTAQGDLLFAINAGHGEFIKMVLAPSDPKDAFHKCVKAFNLADKYQIPVILMTDQFLATSTYSIENMEVEQSKAIFFHADRGAIKDYERYKVTQDGISPRLYPGESKHLVGADSDEHDSYGHITEDLSTTAQLMIEKRLRKLDGLSMEMAMPEEFELADSDLVLVGWGSTRQALLEAVMLLRNDGRNAGLIHFTELWPLPEYSFPKGKQYWSVENNATSQLARLLRCEYDLVFKGAINRYDGLPITANYIRRFLHE